MHAARKCGKNDNEGERCAAVNLFVGRCIGVHRNHHDDQCYRYQYYQIFEYCQIRIDLLDGSAEVVRPLQLGL